MPHVSKRADDSTPANRYPSAGPFPEGLVGGDVVVDAMREVGMDADAAAFAGGQAEDVLLAAFDRVEEPEGSQVARGLAREADPVAQLVPEAGG